MEALDIKSIKNIKNEENKKLSELGVRERKKKVISELNGTGLTTLELKNLLNFFNTNEDLIYKYFLSLNKEITNRNWKTVSNCLNNISLKYLKDNYKTIFLDEIMQYSNYMSISKLNELKQIIYGNAVMGFRSISYKTIFFNFLASLKKDKKKELEKNLGTLNSSIKKRT